LQVSILKPFIMSTFSRRNFIRTTVAGSLATIAYPRIAGQIIHPEEKFSRRSRVSVTTGENRTEMVFKALEPF